MGIKGGRNYCTACVVTTYQYVIVKYSYISPRDLSLVFFLKIQLDKIQNEKFQFLSFQCLSGTQVTKVSKLF